MGYLFTLSIHNKVILYRWELFWVRILLIHSINTITKNNKDLRHSFKNNTENTEIFLIFLFIYFNGRLYFPGKSGKIGDSWFSVKCT